MGHEPNPLPRRANRRPFSLASVGKGPVTLPLKRQDLAAFSHLETRRERRAALRAWKKAIARYQKLVGQAHKDDTVKSLHAETVTTAGAEPRGKAELSNSVLQEPIQCNPAKQDSGTDSTSVG